MWNCLVNCKVPCELYMLLMKGNNQGGVSLCRFGLQKPSVLTLIYSNKMQATKPWVLKMHIHSSFTLPSGSSAVTRYIPEAMPK